MRRLRSYVLPGALPSVIIPGAMKAGTTSLFGYLEGHPQIAASIEKEVHYFDHSFERGPGWYRRQFLPTRFTDDGRPTLSLESSPYYMFEPRVPSRIRELVPDVRLVFLLRDPVDRAYSHYQNNLRLGRESLSFEGAIDAEEERLAGEEDRLLADPSYVSLPHRRYSYCRRGLYAEQLLRWRRHFPPHQMLVIDAARVFARPHEVLEEVLAFLGIDPWVPKSFAPLNEGRYRDPMSTAVRRRLERFFDPHERRLVDLIGWRPSATL